MSVLGLMLILVAAGIVVFALASSSNYSTQIPRHGIGLSFTATPLAIYLGAAVSVIFLGLGVALILRGTGREWGRHKEHKEHKELKQLRKKSATAPTGTADGCGPLVLRPVSGKPIDRRDAYRMVTRIAKAAGIPRHISPHSLRHAANALDSGVPLRDAQILARHADPRTTEHYDRARGNLDRHGVHFLTAYVAGV